MSEMTDRESWERFSESLKRAISRAKELGRAQLNNNWFQVAANLKKTLDNAETIYKNKSLTRAQTIAMLDHRIDRAVAAETRH